MLDALLIWGARVLTACFVLASILPFFQVGWWWVRLWDFPRLQIVALLTIPVALLAAHIARNELQPEHAWMLVGLVAVAVWQTTHVFPFTPLTSVEVPATRDGDEGSTIRLLISNVEVTNDKHEAARAVFREHSPDVLILIELDESWEQELRPIAEGYPFRVTISKPEGLGLALWSRIPFAAEETRHLVSERRPSIFTDIRLPSGDTLRIAALHPTPPGLQDSTDGGRRHSRVRDAELVQVAREVRENPHTPWIVAGDFNDVAWSHTTRLFKRLSGLLDPRVGRTMLPTFHAEYPLLRYPIDHVFVSKGFTLDRLERIRMPGSDHFAVAAQFTLAGEGRIVPRPKHGEKEEASEIARTGHEHAEDRDVESRAG